MQNVTIYTDGACSGNPGPGGYAAVIIYGDNEKEIFGREDNTTNNRMELRAAIEGLKALTKPCEVKLYSDSAYLVNAYNNKWVKNWKKNGWKNASKEPVKNVDLWEQLEGLMGIHKVEFIKVKGHADNKYNNRCDELAVAAIQNVELVKENIGAQREDKIYKIFKDYPTLETERLNIRIFNENDIYDIYEYCSDDMVTRYLSFESYKSIDDAKKRIEYILKTHEELKRPVYWAIELKENNKVIGGIDYFDYDEQANKAEIGFLLNSNYWNKGIMTEALKEVLSFGFENMELNRIQIRCDERNIASERVIVKNGLVYEGTQRQYEFVKGEYVNIKVYSILKEEYYSK